MAPMWGLEGEELQRWNIQLDLIVSCLRSHGVNVDVEDNLHPNLAQITKAKPGT